MFKYKLNQLNYLSRQCDALGGTTENQEEIYDLINSASIAKNTLQLDIPLDFEVDLNEFEPDLSSSMPIIQDTYDIGQDVDTKMEEVLYDQQLEMTDNNKESVPVNTLTDNSTINTSRNIESNQEGIQIDYNKLPIAELFAVVKEYMISQGVEEHTIPLEVLEEKFGSLNIAKLIRKSYILLRRNECTISN